jgi:hypothetical protein
MKEVIIQSPLVRSPKAQGAQAHQRGITVRPGTAMGVDPEFLSTAAGSVISGSMLLPVPP